MVGVCGSVGSGKSSLVNAILGQMEKVKGTCKVRGKFAYVAQEAWIFNATVRENILFGKPMDEKRYAMVLDACSLKQDLTILTHGDETEVINWAFLTQGSHVTIIATFRSTSR